MIYAPGDFSDMHMRVQGSTMPDDDFETIPLIQGFVGGFEAKAPEVAGAGRVTVTLEFNLVMEYIPKPILYQMVERKPAVPSSKQMDAAEGAVSRPDTGVDTNS
jgi:hypothetical protein